MRSIGISDVKQLKKIVKPQNNVSRLEKRLDSTNLIVSEFSEQLNVRDQDGRRNNLEISGVLRMKTYPKYHTGYLLKLDFQE